MTSVLILWGNLDTQTCTEGRLSEDTQGVRLVKTEAETGLMQQKPRDSKDCWPPQLGRGKEGFYPGSQGVRGPADTLI